MNNFKFQMRVSFTILSLLLSHSLCAEQLYKGGAGLPVAPSAGFTSISSSGAASQLSIPQNTIGFEEVIALTLNASGVGNSTLQNGWTADYLINNPTNNTKEIPNADVNYVASEASGASYINSDHDVIRAYVAALYSGSDNTMGSVGVDLAQGGEASPQAVSDPVDSVSGAFLVDEVDLTLAGPLPLQIRRNYSSNNAGWGQFGYSWKSSLVPYLQSREGSEKLLIGAELDGTTVEYVEVHEGLYRSDEPYKVSGKDDVVSNQHLSNNSTRGSGGLSNIFNQEIRVTQEQSDPDPNTHLVTDISTHTTDLYTLHGSDGSTRLYYERGFPVGEGDSLIERERPYLYQWKDNRGNYLTFHYGNIESRWDYGQLRQIRSSNGNFVNFEYDTQGHIIKAYTDDGRHIDYTYNSSGDLARVERPDNSVIEYKYKVSNIDPDDNITIVDHYSTHLIEEIHKPNGRLLKNEYDGHRRVTQQWATVGDDTQLVRNAIFVYGTGKEDDVYNAPVVDDLSELNPRRADNLTGWTRIYDFRNEPSANPLSDTPGNATYSVSNPETLGNNCMLYEYTDGLITRQVNVVGQETIQEWYTSRDNFPDPNAVIPADGHLHCCPDEEYRRVLEKAINCGSTEPYLSTEGILYQADEYFDSGTLEFDDELVNRTSDDLLYQTYRERAGNNDVDYIIPLENGTKEVVLHFCEFSNTASPSGRKVNIIMEGETVEDTFNYYNEGHTNNAIVKKYTIEVNDGVLDLKLDRINWNPDISAIEVYNLVEQECSGNCGESQSVTRTLIKAINCGSNSDILGPEGVLFEADVDFNGGSKSNLNGTQIFFSDYDDLMNRRRVGDSFFYEVAVPEPANYQITLGLYEENYKAENERLFNVFINDQLYLPSLDLFKTAGFKIPYEPSFIIESDGSPINIAFEEVQRNPRVSYILVEKINDDAIPVRTAAAGYPRSLKKRVNARGLTTYFWYDANGNNVLKKIHGDFTGDGAPETKEIRSEYDINTNLLTATEADVYEADGSSVVSRSEVSYDATYSYLPTETVRFIDGAETSRNKITYTAEGTDSGFTGHPHAAAPFAIGLPDSTSIALGSTESAHARNVFDERGFLIKTIQFGDTGLTNVPSAVNSPDDSEVSFHYNNRNQLVESVNRSGTKAYTERDAAGRPIISRIYDESGALLTHSNTYYNLNGEVTWVDGPRHGPEDYILRDYDANGRVIAQIAWRSEAKSDGSGVQAAGGQDWFLGQSVTRYEYNAFDDLLKTIDPRGNETVFTYDELGRTLTTTSYDGAVGAGNILSTSSQTYHPTGDVATTTNALGATTSYFYNTLGNIIEQRSPDGVVQKWTYYPDGRSKEEIRANSSGSELNKWVTTYDENFNNSGNTHRKVTKSYYNLGAQIANVTTVCDRRGNTIQSTGLDGYTSTAAFDGLGRSVQTTGPPASGYSEQQTSSTEYDLISRTVKSTNGVNEYSITQADALGRTISSQVYDSAGLLHRQSSVSYSPDFHSTEYISGDISDALDYPTKSVVYTNLQGQPVVSQKYSSATDYDFTLAEYDVSGNLVRSLDELGQPTVATYDGLNRPITSMGADGSETSIRYDLLGNVTDTFYPRGLHQQSTFDQIGRKLSEKLIGQDQGVSRHLSYAYYPSGNFVGLLKTTVDLSRGLTTEMSDYDDFLRVSAVDHTSSQKHLIGVSKTYEYDHRGNLLECTQEHDRIHPAVVNSATYDGYSQPTSLSVSFDGDVVSGMPAHQYYDEAGRREKLAYTVDASEDHRFTFGYAPDGKIDNIGLTGNALSAAYTSSLSYTTSGAYHETVTPWFRKNIERDSRGRPTSTQHFITANTSAFPDITEAITYRDDSRIQSRSINADQHDYHYDAKGRLIQDSYNHFKYDPTHLGALIKRAKATGAPLTGLESYDTAEEQLTVMMDEFGRPQSLHLVGDAGASQTAFGTVNDDVSVYLEVTNQADNSVFRYEDVSVTPANPFDGNYDWSASLNLPQGDYSLIAKALHPSGAYDAIDSQTFTVSQDSVSGLTTEYDQAGYPIRQKSQDGLVRSFSWDVLGRLLSVTEIGASIDDSWKWQAEYDSFSRRFQTKYEKVSEGVNLVTTSLYDPQYEFLELMMRTEGTDALGSAVTASPVWKLHGVDLSGSYGAYNGIGGVSGSITPHGSVGYLTDSIGDVLATVKDGTLSDRSRADSYGNTEGAVSYPDVSSASLNYQSNPDLALHWKSRAPDPTGYYWFGKRYYDARSARFISPDPLGHAGSWDLYTYAMSDPVNYLDPDGRLVKSGLEGVENWSPSGYIAGDAYGGPQELGFMDYASAYYRFQVGTVKGVGSFVGDTASSLWSIHPIKTGYDVFTGQPTTGEKMFNGAVNAYNNPQGALDSIATGLKQTAANATSSPEGSGNALGYVAPEIVLSVVTAGSTTVAKRSLDGLDILEDFTDLAPRGKVNIDTGTASAFVSENSPVRHSLKAELGDRQMIMTETAAGEFNNMIRAAGPQEAARAQNFLNLVQIVPDTPSLRAMNLKTTKKVGANDVFIFGTGDYFSIPTMTSDAKFLRGASAQGVDFNAILHNPVPLTGQ
ncbi:MAG: malectin domain-containing carbohydrate-binding protein [Akkermansiaceae bacterium]